ncbi:hypothetical protein D1F64_21165 [Breoghania sp. L-A4]|nr:hypothetical protein D1F64_21165 [Breoghania sp. L-A4]
MCTALSGGWLIAAVPGFAADYSDAAFGAGTRPAVSEINGKIAGGFGIFDDDALAFGLGSVSVPLGHAFGFQLDGIGGGAGSGFGGVAGHAFWRDPDRALLGVYASYLKNNRVDFDVGHVAAEGEFYFNRVSLEGLAGVEFGDADTDFYGSANLAFYPVDDLRLYAGYRYVNEINVAAAGFEWQVPNDRVHGLSLFGDGRVSDTRLWSVFAGLRIYLGDDKSLIRRHREDDPNGTQLIDDLFGLSDQRGSSCDPPNMIIDGTCVIITPE